MKNRDPVSVGRLHTSRRYYPFHSSTSGFRRLSSYSLNTAPTPPAAPPPGLCLLLITWLDDRGCVCGCFCLCVGSSCLLPLSFQGHATPPPAIFLVDSGIYFILPHTLISAGSVTDLPLGIALASASRSYTTQVDLPLVSGAVLRLCLAGSWIPPPSQRNGVRRWAVGGLTTYLGLSVFPFPIGLGFSVFREFDCSLSRVSFLRVARLWRSLIRVIQACGFLVVSTYSTKHCFLLYSKLLTGWAGSEGFTRKKRDGLWLGVFCLHSAS